MSTKITTFLMFNGEATEAMDFYMSLFDNSEVKNVSYYGKEGPGKEGTIISAVFTLDGHEYMCIDSSIKHDFTFTPAINLFVDCDSESQVDRLYTALSENGNIMMEIGNYGFSQKFA